MALRSKEKTMKCILFSGNQEIGIDAANLEEANLSEQNNYLVVPGIEYRRQLDQLRLVS